MAVKRKITTARAALRSPEEEAARTEADESVPPLESSGEYAGAGSSVEPDPVNEDLDQLSGDAPAPELEPIEKPSEDEGEKEGEDENLSKRDILYADIERRKEEREKQQREALEAEESAPAPDDEPSAADKPEPAAKPAAKPAEDPDDDPDVTMQVDRRKITMKRSEWDERARRSIAEGNRLEEMNRLLAEQRRVAQTPTPTDTGEPPEPAPAPSRADADTEPKPRLTRDEAKEIVESIQLGDPDDAADAVLSLAAKLAVPPEPAIDAKAVGELIDQKQRATDTERSIRDEMSRFSEVFPEVTKDPVLVQATFNRMHDEQMADIESLKIKDSQGNTTFLSEADLEPIRKDPRLIPIWHKQYRERGLDVRNISDLVDAAGKYVDEKYITRSEPTPKKDQSSSQLAQRRADKRANLQRQPRRATATPSQTVAPEVPTSSVIGEMRDRRVGRTR